MTLIDSIDPADRRQAQAERRNAKLKDVRRDDERIRKTVIQALMSEPRGRRYVWQELAECKVFTQTIVFAAGGTMMTAFNEGIRSVGLRLLADVTRWCPQEYMKMTVENAAVELKDEIDGGSDDDPGTE